VARKPALFAPPPARWRLHGWAVVLRSGGYQTPHIHPDGIVSGVYYVRVPDTVRDATGEAAAARRRPARTSNAEAQGLIVTLDLLSGPEERIGRKPQYGEGPESSESIRDH